MDSSLPPSHQESHEKSHEILETLGDTKGLRISEKIDSDSLKEELGEGEREEEMETSRSLC
jgi:hypothetical protein